MYGNMPPPLVSIKILCARCHSSTHFEDGQTEAPKRSRQGLESSLAVYQRMRTFGWVCLLIRLHLSSPVRKLMFTAPLLKLGKGCNLDSSKLASHPQAEGLKPWVPSAVPHKTWCDDLCLQP